MSFALAASRAVAVTRGVVPPHATRNSHRSVAIATAVACAWLLAPAGVARAAEAAPAATSAQRLPTSTGEVLLPSATAVKYHDEWQFAAARRAGDLLFVSGVVAGPRPGEKPTVEAFQASLRRAFDAIGQALRAGGLGFEHVALMNTFHVWNTPHFAGTKQQQFQAMLAVKQDYMQAPHTAWTAVGVTELLPDTGVVEIQVIAAYPRAAAVQ